MGVEQLEPEEAYYDDNIVYQINTFGADFTVDGLIKRFERGDIFRPQFQRNFVWNINQASRFVESILLGLPIPSVFLYREEDSNRHLIVDGLQRLTTLHGFATGYLPNPERRFRLKNVQRRFEGRTVDDLEASDQRRFYDAIIHSMIIQQTAPDDDRSSVFHIFERLNTNGTPLKPQEMRAAIYHGPFQELLAELNLEKSWRQIFGPLNKRLKDQELILRFLALAFNREHYRKPMAAFLNHFMFENRALERVPPVQLSRAFTNAVDRSFQAFGEAAFKRNKSLNVALYDALMVGILENPQADSRAINKATEELLENEHFKHAIERATSDEVSVRTRIELAVNAIRAAA